MQLDEQIPRYSISSFSSAFPNGLGFVKCIFSVILSSACLLRSSPVQSSISFPGITSSKEASCA
jgi:hypothetical protein